MECGPRFFWLAFAKPEPLLFSRIPCDVECLQSAATDIGKILLQRLIGKSVLDLKLRLFAVSPFGADEEPFVPAKEG